MKKVAFLVFIIALGMFADEVKFMAIDVYADSRDKQLVAWQLQLQYPETIKLISIENGESKAFDRLPDYNKKLADKGRVVIAAFTTNDQAAPKGENRIMRLHIQYTGDKKPQFNISVLAAASPGGKRIPIKCRYQVYKQEKKND